MKKKPNKIVKKKPFNVANKCKIVTKEQIKELKLKKQIELQELKLKKQLELQCQKRGTNIINVYEEITCEPSTSNARTTEQEEEESNSFLPLMDIETNNEFSEDSLAPIERVLNVSEHETSTELRSSNVIFFEKLVPAKANIQANIWEDRTEIPSGPKENVMYVMKNFNKDRKGRYKNPSCDYGPWNVSTHVSQYQIKDNALQYMGETENRDFGIKDCEKVVLKSSRCYLQANRKYVKYVTYVKQCPEEYVSAKDYCTVEYVGIDINGPNTKPHRNSKNGVPYKRNNEYMLEEAKDMFKKGKMSVKEVLSELSDSYKGETLPSARALYNMKYQLQKKKEKKKEQEQADFSTDQIKIETDDL